ncbi:MAG: hypothetical protein V3R87_09330, partial [Dehalococcoidia bacterium]
MSRVIAQGLTVLLLLGILALAPVAVVSASAPQLWYLDSTEHPAAQENGTMQKGNAVQSGLVEVPAEGFAIWLAENAARTDVTFPGGSWVIELKVDAVPTFDAGGSWQASIGGWNTTDGWYEIPTLTAAIVSWDDGANALIVELQTDPATIPEGDYLALMATNQDLAAHSINTDGRSSLRSPDTDPGYPLPELATAILLGAGLLGLLAYSRLKPANS